MSKPDTEFEVQWLRERRECIPLSLGMSSILALLTLVAIFATADNPVVARAGVEKYGILWFIGWWVFCHTMSAVKIQIIRDDESEQP